MAASMIISKPKSVLFFCRAPRHELLAFPVFYIEPTDMNMTIMELLQYSPIEVIIQKLDLVGLDPAGRFPCHCYRKMNESR